MTEKEITTTSQLPPTVPKKGKLTKIIVIALIAMCILTATLTYYLGNSNGYTTGLKEGRTKGYSEGWSEGQFYFYYVRPKEQRYGDYNLSQDLKDVEWTISYQEGFFDCSEMSAFLEWYLESKGWHTKIAVGDVPFAPAGSHAWILVETSIDGYMPVETTIPDIIWQNSTYFNGYSDYEQTFETIEDALAISESEFDWWNSHIKIVG